MMQRRETYILKLTQSEADKDWFAVEIKSVSSGEQMSFSEISAFVKFLETWRDDGCNSGG